MGVSSETFELRRYCLGRGAGGENNVKNERVREKKDRNHCMLPPGVLAGATARQDIVKLVITINLS